MLAAKYMLLISLTALAAALPSVDASGAVVGLSLQTVVDDKVFGVSGKRFSGAKFRNASVPMLYEGDALKGLYIPSSSGAK